MIKVFAPSGGMLAVSSSHPMAIEKTQHLYVRLDEHEAECKYCYDNGHKVGAELKRADYLAAKEVIKAGYEKQIQKWKDYSSAKEVIHAGYEKKISELRKQLSSVKGLERVK